MPGNHSQTHLLTAVRAASLVRAIRSTPAKTRRNQEYCGPGNHSQTRLLTAVRAASLVRAIISAPTKPGVLWARKP